VRSVTLGRIEEFDLDDLSGSRRGGFRLFSTQVGARLGHLGQKVFLQVCVTQVPTRFRVFGALFNVDAVSQWHCSKVVRLTRITKDSKGLGVSSSLLPER
jgi:hypothetical protein